MKSKHIIFLILLLFGLSNAISYQRPWENATWIAKNPNIWSYGVQVWWNVPAFHNSLDVLETSPISRMNLSASASKALNRLNSAKNVSTNDYYQCMAGLNTISFAAISFDFSAASASTIVAFSQFPYCLKYSSDWKETVDASLNLAEISITEAKTQTSVLNEEFIEIRDAGLCSENYSGPGSYDCNIVENLLSGTENNILAGSFDQLRVLSNNSGILNEELRKPVPNIASTIVISSIIWDEDGYLSQLSAARSSIARSMTLAESAYSSKKSNVELYESQINSKITSLNSQKINLITISPSSSSSSSLGSVGSVKDRYEKYLSENNGLSKNLLSALNIHKNPRNSINQPVPYLSTSIDLLTDIESNSSLLLSNLNSLEDDAHQAESEQREEADSEIKLSESSLGSSSTMTSSNMLNDAKSLFNSAQNAPTVGQRFDLYRQATAMARSARNQKSLAEEINISVSLSSLEDLIKRAEADNLSVISEKEGLRLIKNLKDYEIKNYTNTYTESIISKAKIKYENQIIQNHLEILEQLRLAGPDAADLYTDLSNYEEGILENGAISYPASIGKLSKLISNYKKLRSTLVQYESNYVSSAISTSATPNFDSIYLDQPSNVSLDILFTNPTNYSGTNVQGIVSLQSPMDLLYSDIVGGKDDVSNLRMPTDKSLVITFRSFLPFETKRIILEKQITLAHTRKTNGTSIGLGAGKVLLNENIDIEVDHDIPHLSFIGDYDDLSIDGKYSQAPLAAGNHRVVLTKSISNAYSESIENIRVYKIGLNSHVEYDFRVVPTMDIDLVPITVLALNSTSVSNLAIYSSSGETLKDKSRVSDTEIFANIAGLKKNKVATIKVSYDVHDTASYVSDQLSLLSNVNLSQNGRSILTQARRESERGNSTGALELIEKLKSTEQNFIKNQENIKSQKNLFIDKIQKELLLLDIILTMSNKSTFYPKFVARKAELQRLILGSNSSDLNSSLVMLSSYDESWLVSQMDLYKKDLYRNYNSLRERLSKVGNYSTPEEFVILESEIAKIEASQRPEYIPSSFAAFEDARDFVESNEKMAVSNSSLQKSRFDDSKSKLLEIFSKYSKLASTAKGTEYAHIFDQTDKSINGAIKEAQDSIKNPVVFERKISQLDSISTLLSLSIESLKNESVAKHSLLSQLVAESNLPSDKKEQIIAKLGLMQSMITSGEYVNALRAGSSIAREIDNVSNSSDNSLLLLAITAFVILAIIILFIFKRKGEEKPSALLKKLETFDEEQHHSLSS